MKILNLVTQGAKIAGEYLVKNSPTILTSVGIGGFVAAIVMATKEPVKVEEELYELERKEEAADIQKHAIMPRAKIYAKHYWPTAAVAVTSAGCLIFANKIHLGRQAALLAAYQLSTTNLTDLKNKIIQMDGEKKLRALNDDIAKDKVESAPTSQVIVTGNGSSLIYDLPSGRYFMSDIEKVRKAVDSVNRRLYNGEAMSLNDFYDELGLDHVGVGYKLGWRLNTTDDLLEMEYSSHIADNGVPALVLKYDVKPIFDYDW